MFALYSPLKLDTFTPYSVSFVYALCIMRFFRDEETTRPSYSV
ncbi:Protein of unknown function [Anaplasma phagocytophilum]|uniref:Uncharacterized protein n=1 Tax=Anaplasma phagocytophilum TaxID=948 RepID=A0A098EEQ8_ANAPH|nr:Protein of unknown function [Anaplasma phagocytophilum]